MKPESQSIFRLLLLPVIAAVAIGTPAQAQDAEALIDRAMTASHRSDANKARDKYRHPKETLLFFAEAERRWSKLPHGRVYTQNPGAGTRVALLRRLIQMTDNHRKASAPTTRPPRQARGDGEFTASTTFVFAPRRSG